MVKTESQSIQKKHGDGNNDLLGKMQVQVIKTSLPAIKKEKSFTWTSALTD